MIRLCFTIFVILFVSLFITTVFNIPTGKSIPLSYVVLAFLMFFMSMFTKISFFKYFILIIIFLMFVYLAIGLKKNRYCIESVLKQFLKPSLFVFMLSFIYLYFVCKNIQLSNIDDIGYWGTRVLDINRTDALYTKEYTVFSYFSYPPFTALLQIVFVKLLGEFNQSYLILAQCSFCLTLFLNLFDKYKNKINCLLKILLTLFTIICVTLMIQKNKSFGDDAFIYNAIYVDWLIGLILGKILSLYYDFDSQSYFSYLEIGLYESALILIKPTTIPLVFLSVVTGFICVALKNKKILLPKENRNNFILFILGLPILIYAIWKIYFGLYSNNKSQLSPTMIKAILLVALFVIAIFVIIGFVYKKYNQKINLKYVFGTCLLLPMVLFSLCLIFNSSMFEGNDNYYLSIALRFIEAYFSSPIWIHPFKITYYFINLFVTAALLLIGKYRNKDNSYYSIPVMFYFGSIGYALMIMISYMFVFGYEGYSLVVFGRYMQTYTYAGVVLLVLIALDDYLKYSQLAVLALVSTLFVEPDSVSTIIYNKNWQNYRTNAQIQALSDYFEYEYDGGKMAVFAQDDMRDLSLVGYIADDKKQNIKYYEGITEEDSYRFDEAIENNEYAFVGTRNELLVELWSKYSDEEPYNMSLYKINHDNDKITIELMYTWDDLN